MSLNGILERMIAGRWIAGESVSDAISVATRLNRRGVTAMVNYLGENFTEEKEVESAVKTYESVMAAASSVHARISLAVKPTELGLLIGQKTAEKNYSRLVALARKRKIFVWLDMEEHEYVDKTLAIYLKELGRGGVGICIQSYLRRSESDVKMLVRAGGVIRLVKGAYKEGASIAYQTRSEATKNYSRIMGYLFSKGGKFMIATHDDEMIREALELGRRHKARPSFAMLYGIRNNYAFSLAERGEDVSIYVPFGKAWAQYGYRRLKELENSKLFLRSLLGG